MCRALLADEPRADENGRWSYCGKTKISRTVGDSQEKCETDQMKENKMLPKCRSHQVALTPQSMKSEQINIGNKSIDEQERDEVNDVYRCMYQWKLMEIGSGGVDLPGRHKSKWKQDEIEENSSKICFMDVVPKDAREYQGEWQNQSCELRQDIGFLALGSFHP
jgi:hypothetical protein